MKFDNDKVVFIHIPRTAGSYIEKVLSDKYKIKRKWPKPDQQHLFGLLKLELGHYLTLQHLTIKEMFKYNFLKKQEEQYIFTVVRHPYKRTLSLYQNWFRGFKKLEDFLTKLEEMKLDDYKFEGITTENKNFSAQTMARIHNLDAIKYFVLPQFYYVQNDDNLDIDIMKFEEMEKLNDKLNLQIKFNTSISKKYNLTEEQKKRIQKIYKVDFDNFGFEK